jgi:hypothetical protein
MRTFPSAPLVRPFADRLLRLDFPSLPASNRTEVVAFTTRRVETLPSITYLGVVFLAAIVRLVLLLPGSDTTLRFLARTSLPLLGEYTRLVRSLGYAYIWDTWPDTAPDGRLAA